MRHYWFALGPLAAAALWGGMYVVSKWGFAFVPPVTLGFLRVALAAMLLWPIVRWRSPSIDRADYGRIALLGGWVTLTIAAQFLGTELTNASQGSLLTVLTPVFTVLLGAAILGERLTRRIGVGLSLAAIGTAFVLAGQYDRSEIAAGSAVGVALLVVASLAWAGYTVWGVAAVRKYGALPAATYSAVAATPMLGALALVELAFVDIDRTLRALSLESVAAVVYLGVAATALAWYLWYKGLEYAGAGAVSAFFFAQPVVGALLGAALLGERLGPGFAVGGVTMAVGVWLVATAAGR
ncbi:DMT family transporter [Haloferacaceae archaeon DSL9]